MSIKELYRIVLTVFVIVAALYKYPRGNKREKIAMIILVVILLLITILHYF